MNQYKINIKMDGGFVVAEGRWNSAPVNSAEGTTIKDTLRNLALQTSAFEELDGFLNCINKLNFILQLSDIAIVFGNVDRYIEIRITPPTLLCFNTNFCKETSMFRDTEFGLLKETESVAIFLGPPYSSVVSEFNDFIEKIVKYFEKSCDTACNLNFLF